MKFVKQISIKFEGFYVIKMNMVQTVLSTSTPNIGGNSCIGRYSRDQIVADRYIGRSPNLNYVPLYKDHTDRASDRSLCKSRMSSINNTF